MANPTTNYGWPMPTSTDLVTDLPADFAAFGQPVDTTLKALNPETTLGDISYRSATSNTNTRLGIGTNGQVLGVVAGVPAWTTDASGMTNPMTTTGDTIYSSSGSTPARLGIGTTGQVLTVTAGLPAWGTLATNKTIAQIATGTMPAASSLSLTGLSSYDTLIVRLDGITMATSNASVMVTINSDTAANYELVGSYNQTTFSTGFYSTATNYFYAGFGAASQLRTDTDNGRFYVFTNCKAAGFTNATVQEKFLSSGGDTPNASSVGIYKGAAAVSSLQFKTSTGNNFTAGNYIIWGG